MRFAKSALVTLLAKGLALPIGIASSIITARVLGPEGRGILAILILFQSLTVTFGMMGLNGSITYFMARIPEKASNIVRNAFTLAIVGGMIVAGLLWSAARAAPSLVLGNIDIRYLEIFLLSIPFSFLSQFLQNVFLAKQKFVEYNLLDLIVRFAQMLLFGVVLLALGGDTTDAVWIFTGITIFGGIMYTVRVNRVQRFTPGFDTGLFRQMLSYGLRVYTASLVSFLALRIHLFMINVMLGEEQAGIYAVAAQIVDVIYIVPVTLGLIIFPKVSAGEDPESLLTLRVFRIALVGMMVVAGTIVVSSEILIHVMFGEAFAEAAIALRLLAPAIVALSLSNIISADLAGRGMPLIVLYAPLTAVIVMAPALYILLPDYGIASAAAIASAGHIIIMAILVLYVKDKQQVPWSAFLKFRWRDLRIGRING